MKIFLISFSLICLFFSPAFAQESLTITTYYPSPYGNYHELRSQRMAVGDSYIDNNQYCWEGTCTNLIDDDANPATPSKVDLIVEGNVGIGTSAPTENLEVTGRAKTEAVILTPGTFTDVNDVSNERNGMLYYNEDPTTHTGNVYLYSRDSASASSWKTIIMFTQEPLGSVDISNTNIVVSTDASVAYSDASPVLNINAPKRGLYIVIWDAEIRMNNFRSGDKATVRLLAGTKEIQKTTYTDTGNNNEIFSNSTIVELVQGANTIKLQGRVYDASTTHSGGPPTASFREDESPSLSCRMLLPY